MIWENNIWKAAGNTILFIVIVPFFLLYLPFALLVYVVISLFWISGNKGKKDNV